MVGDFVFSVAVVTDVNEEVRSMSWRRRRRARGLWVLGLMILLVFGAVTAAAEVRVLFSPEAGAKILETLVARIEGAEERIYILMYSFTLEELAHALVARHEDGVDLRVVMDRRQAGLKKAVDETLEERGIPVRRLGGSNGGCMHIKMMIVDDAVITGSYNWSRGAAEKNDENLLIIEDEEEVLKAHLEKFEKLWQPTS